MDAVYQLLCDRFQLAPPIPIQILIQPSSQCLGGISGSSSAAGLSFCAGNWADNHWCYGLLIQELVNLFTGQFGGWPTDWWANGQSPFPIQISTQTMFETGKTLQAQQHNSTFINDPWYARFRNLQNRYGWQLWRNLFNLFQTQHVDLHALAEPVKSSVVMSYLAFFEATT